MEGKTYSYRTCSLLWVLVLLRFFCCDILQKAPDCCAESGYFKDPLHLNTSMWKSLSGQELKNRGLKNYSYASHTYSEGIFKLYFKISFPSRSEKCSCKKKMKWLCSYHSNFKNHDLTYTSIIARFTVNSQDKETPKAIHLLQSCESLHAPVMELADHIWQPAFSQAHLVLLVSR